MNDAPAWIEAIATCLAFAAAAVAVAVATKAYQKEVARDERRELERRFAQAEQVAAWCDRYDYSPAQPSRVATRRNSVYVTKAVPEPDWRYYVRNASDTPVYDLVVLFRIGDHSLGTDQIDVLPPGGEAVDRDVPESIRSEARSVADELGEVIRPHLTFRDSAGRGWTRTTDGRLHARDEDPPTQHLKVWTSVRRILDKRRVRGRPQPGSALTAADRSGDSTNV